MNVRSRMLSTPRLSFYCRPFLHLHRHGRPSRLRRFYSIDSDLSQSEIAHAIMDQVHNLSGLPWSLSIPLTAILLRASITLPISYAIYRNERSMQPLRPLVNAYRSARKAWVPGIARGQSTAPRFPFDELASKHSALQRVLSPWGQFRQLGLFFLVLYFPFWTSFFNALRGMSGMQSPIMDPSLEELPPAVPSLEAEGALWFPDLTAFDPTLSLTFSALFFANALHAIHLRLTPADCLSKIGWDHLGLQSTSALVLAASSLILGFAFHTLKLPAAVLLFCVASSLCAIVQRSILAGMIKEVARGTIQPVQARSAVIMRRKVVDASGHIQYVSSNPELRRWDALFAPRPIEAITAQTSTTHPRPKQLVFRAPVAPKPTKLSTQNGLRKG